MSPVPDGPPTTAPVNQQLDNFIAGLARTNVIIGMAVPLVKMFIGALRTRLDDIPDVTEEYVTRQIQASREAHGFNAKTAEDWLRAHAE